MTLWLSSTIPSLVASGVVVGVAVEHGGGGCVIVYKSHVAMCPCTLVVLFVQEKRREKRWDDLSHPLVSALVLHLHVRRGRGERAGAYLARAPCEKWDWGESTWRRALTSPFMGRQERRERGGLSMHGPSWSSIL